MGLSENRVYSQWNSHLIGIMISKTIGFRGTLFSDKPIYIICNTSLMCFSFETSQNLTFENLEIEVCGEKPLRSHIDGKKMLIQEQPSRSKLMDHYQSWFTCSPLSKGCLNIDQHWMPDSSSMFKLCHWAFTCLHLCTSGVLSKVSKCMCR